MKKNWLAPERWIRILADAVLLTIALALALAVRFAMIRIAGIELEDPWALVNSYANFFALNALPLAVFCIVSLTLFGVYTHTRAYRGRYKAIVVVQGVSIAYLLYGFLSYFVLGTLFVPRGVLLLGLVFSVALLVAARLWSSLWVRLASREKKHNAEGPIKRVLLIGGAGYIGSGLLPRLLDRGYSVRVLDLLMFGTEPIQDCLGHPNLEIMQADFRQVDKVVEAMRDVDAVIHLGALVGDPACAVDEDLTIEINLMATRVIAEVAKGNGIRRFIFASTCSVYGASDELLDEKSALNPVSLYASSKIASEQVLLGMSDERFAPILLRFGTIYGLSGRTRFDLVVNLLTAKAVVDKKITVFGGDQWRPFVHVNDAGLAVLKALEAPLAVVNGQVFNVGSDKQNYTIQQVAELIQHIVPEASLVSMGQDGDRRNYRVSFAKIRQVLDFTPEWTVERGIAQVIDAVRSGAVADYRDAKYSNVKFLNEEGLNILMRPQSAWAREMVRLAAVPSSVGG